MSVKYHTAVQVSGGGASYVAAKLTLEALGHEGVAFVFADTLIEDEDLYRFLNDVEEKLAHPIIRIAEGRDPWQVFFDKRFLGNSQVDPCSMVLKRQMLDRWRKANCVSECNIIIGFDANEDHRLKRLLPRMLPDHVRAPLLELGIWREDIRAIVEGDGLVMPRLYDWGFAHNNCGGFCIKAGQASFALLLEKLPERYAYHENKEEELRTFLDKDVAIMRDRRGGETKPLTMRNFRLRHQGSPEETDRFDLGGCSCMESADDQE